MTTHQSQSRVADSRLHDGWFRLVGIPLIALMSHLVFYNRNDGGEERFGFWTIYLISVAETMIVWELVRLILYYFRRRMPSIEQTRQRIVWVMICSTLATMIIRVLNVWIYDETRLWGYRFPLEGYLQSVFVALLFVLIVSTIYESLYYFKMWHKTSLRAAVLEKENLQTQLDSLKSQINPHFLFNNLSSLAALITENQEKAVHFVEEFSSVFRYLLQANERTLTPLRNEMEFISAYYSLLKNRFEQALQLEVCIPAECNEWLLPPLTIQLLLENAVKHNTVMTEHPLHIRIAATTDGWLTVSNSVHEKKGSAATTDSRDRIGMGLENIRAKYRLLDQPPIIISKDATQFEVKVPLIKNEHHESTDSGR